MLKEREDFYIELIKNSTSLIDVCRKAGIVPTTGNYDTLKKIIRNKQIDVSHFKRVGNVNGVAKKDISEYLVKGSSISSFKLKTRLLKEGYKSYQCEVCGGTKWQGKPIPLELHHINGDKTDNRLENLQILCPNCHAFTDTYGGKNQKMNIKKKDNKNKKKVLTEDEKKEIVLLSFKYDSLGKLAKKTKHTERTVKKVLKEKNIIINKNMKIKKECDEKIPLILESLKKTKTFTGTAKEFGVTDNAIKKLLIRRGYPKRIKEILDKIQQ